MQIGYARVSSTDQDFDAQVERLKAHGCEKVFSEKASGRSTNGRHELSKALRALKPGDTLIVVRLDRLARSIRDLLSLLDTILKRELRVPLADKEYEKIAWLYDRIAKQLGVPPAKSYPRVYPP